MKKLFGLLGVFVLFLLAIVAVLAVVPLDGLAKRALISGTRLTTGLELKINGPLSVRAVPRIDMHLENIVLVDPADAAAKPLVAARKVDVLVGYYSFFFGGRTIDRVALTDAVIDVETDAAGRHSWNPTAPPATRSPAARAPRSFTISDLELKGSRVAYRDQRTGLAMRLERADAALKGVSQDRVGEALVKAGALVVNEQASGTNLEIGDLDAKAAGIDQTRVSSLSAAGGSLRWRDKTQPAGLETTRFSATATALGFDGSGAVSFAGSSLRWREPSGVGQLEAWTFETAAKALRGGRLDDVAFKSDALTYADPATGTINLGKLAGTAKGASAGGADDIAFASGTFAFTQPGGARITANSVNGAVKAAKSDSLADITLKSAAAALEHSATGPISATNVAVSAKAATSRALQGVALSGSTVALKQPTRTAGGAGLEMQEVSFASPLLGFGTPIDGVVAFVHNKDRVSGTIKLPPPESIGQGPETPAVLSLKAGRGTLDFEGRIETGAQPALKGRTRAVTTSVEALASWLGVAVPATLKGPVDINGEIDARESRVAISNGRIAHASNVMTGSFAVDLGAARPKLAGRIAADKLDADVYLGTAPVRPRPQAQAKQASAGKPQIVEPEVELGDVFKSYMRATLAAPASRSGKIEIPDLSADDLIPAATRSRAQAPTTIWSQDKFDLTALRAFDLDIDWSIKQLDVRGMQLSVPQLKTTLAAGALKLEGRDLGTKGGRISGTAEVDARETLPAVAANVRGEGVDLYQLSEALGITPMLDGVSGFEAKVTSRGSSQRQLVEQLSGEVSTNMTQGHVLGYDLGALSLATFIRWMRGAREFDPERRTPITGLNAKLDIKNGIVRDSQVTVGGPLLGVNAEGTMDLIEQRINYRGRARIATWFRGLPFKVIGNWTRPTASIDWSLADVFSRDTPGDVKITDVIAQSDIKPDPELALLIGRVLQRAGTDGIEPGTRALLEAVQKKALGN